MSDFLTLVQSGDFAKLYNGELLPREGDFIGSEIAPTVCGFVVGIKKTGAKAAPIYAFVVELGNGTHTSIIENDYVFIAPREYE